MAGIILSHDHPARTRRAFRTGLAAPAGATADVTDAQRSPGRWTANTGGGESLSVTAMAPAAMVSAAAPPTIMMAPAATVSVSVPVSALDLDRRVTWRGQRCDAEPGGSGCGHRQQQRTPNQCNAFHRRSPIA